VKPWRLNSFEKIWSIELAPALAAAAKKRFAPHQHVQIIEGDSSKVLKQIMPKLDKPTLFWLDGHYSGCVTAKGDVECPILDELDAVFSGAPQRDVILIDDARLFVGQHDYPTIPQIRQHVGARGRDLQLYVADDAIHIHRLD
jgi:hypothetical protein